MMDQDELAALKPVAWLYDHKNARGHVCLSRWNARSGGRASDFDGWTETRLYTADQLQALIDENERLRGAIKAAIAAGDYTPADGEWERGYADGRETIADMLDAALNPPQPVPGDRPKSHDD